MVKRVSPPAAGKQRAAAKAAPKPQAKPTKATPVKAAPVKSAAKTVTNKGSAVKLAKTHKPEAGKSAPKPTSKVAAAPARVVAKAESGTAVKSAVTKATPTKATVSKATVAKATEPKADAKAVGAKSADTKTVAVKAGLTPANAKSVANPVTMKSASTETVSVPASTPPKPANSNVRPGVMPVVGSRPQPGKAAKLDFAPHDYIVYPTHGVGRILRIEKTEIAGMPLELFVIEFDKDKMTLRVPLAKVHTVGMRRLSSPQKMKSALETLKGRARIKRAMWSRRAQEYEAKINSGDPISIAEVVRDLRRNAGQPDQSYSERQIYEAALDRLARELAAVEQIDEDSATKRLEKILKAA